MATGRWGWPSASNQRRAETGGGRVAGGVLPGPAPATARPSGRPVVGLSAAARPATLGCPTPSFVARVLLRALVVAVARASTAGSPTVHRPRRSAGGESASSYAADLAYEGRRGEGVVELRAVAPGPPAGGGADGEALTEGAAISALAVRDPERVPYKTRDIRRVLATLAIPRSIWAVHAGLRSVGALGRVGVVTTARAARRVDAAGVWGRPPVVRRARMAQVASTGVRLGAAAGRSREPRPRQ
jgi:hypothetical protein